jgi:hypothetical protein
VGESLGEYWARKHEELALLAEAAGERAPRVSTGAELCREKQRLRVELLGRALKEAPSLTESNLHGGPRGRFSYSYQRFDLRVRTRRFFEDVYALDARGGLSVGVWGGSGMGTITAALRAVDAWVPSPRRLLYPRDAYFETRNVLPRLERLLPNDDDDELRLGDFFYLDSVTAEDRFRLLSRGPIHALQLLFFDTTCYDAGSPMIGRVLDKCLAHRVPLLLLRSHLKLDVLATEYARLGSAVLWLPPRPARVHIKLARALRRQIIEELSLAGAMPQPPAFWPLYADARARALNQRRNQRMVEAQVRAGAELAARLPALEVGRPHHGCFLTILPRPSTEQAVHAQMRALVSEWNEAGLEARVAPSFGYDLIGVTVLNLAGGARLRIAVPDLADDDIDRLVEIAVRRLAG